MAKFPRALKTKINIGLMPLAYLTFLTGIAISAVAIYYSVLGLAAIFAAAVVPIIIMGTILEVSKLVTAWWLKANWHRAPWSIKIYLTIAVMVLMLITSMGIFGFLSKAHTDQAVPLGDTAAKVAFIDEKINNERETIASARNLIKQLDDAVIGIQSGEGREIRNRDGTTRIENPAERALAVRRSQARDRTALSQTIDEAQARIVALQEEKAPIASQLRAVEAEVGPIKYIAKLIYGDDPDKNLLEKAVVWVIIVIVLVFDPLAVLLLLASQMSFNWNRKEKDTVVEETKAEGDSLTTEGKDDIINPATVTEPVGVIAQEIAEILPEAVIQEEKTDAVATLSQAKIQLDKFLTELEKTNVPMFKGDIKGFTVPKILDDVPPALITSTNLNIDNKNIDNEELAGIDAWNKMIEEAEKAVSQENTDTFPTGRFIGEQLKVGEQNFIFNGTTWIPTPVSNHGQDAKYKIFPELIDQSSYVQNEEQEQSNLWQAARKNVKIDSKDSLSQQDYQEKVHQAILRDLIKDINDGIISITDLTEDEIKDIEDYLKEKNDGQNNTDQST
jgi:hypothetical protein